MDINLVQADRLESMMCVNNDISVSIDVVLYFLNLCVRLHSALNQDKMTIWEMISPDVTRLVWVFASCHTSVLPLAHTFSFSATEIWNFLSIHHKARMFIQDYDNSCNAEVSECIWQSISPQVQSQNSYTNKYHLKPCTWEINNYQFEPSQKLSKSLNLPFFI